MLTECPHCYSDVIVKRDGTCPACLHSVTDLTGTDPDLTKVSLRNGTKDLPRVCIVCGEVATHAVQFTRRARNANYAGDPRVGIGGVGGLVLTRLLDHFSGKTHLEISLHLPVCAQCGSKGREVRVQRLDFENGVATFVAHKRFRSALSGAPS